MSTTVFDTLLWGAGAPIGHTIVILLIASFKRASPDIGKVVGLLLSFVMLVASLNNFASTSVYYWMFLVYGLLAVFSLIGR